MDRETLKDLLGEFITTKADLIKMLNVIQEVIDANPNDMELGAAIRKLRSEIEKVLNEKTSNA